MATPDYLSVSKSRPTSISVIAWLLIVLNAFALLGMLMTLNNPQAKAIMAQSSVPLSVQYALGFGGLVIILICAIGMLHAYAWSRIAYVVWNLIATLYALITSPFKLMILPGFVIFLVISFFLIRPAANQYFAQGGAMNDGQIG
jgi:hypothetical protein